MKITFLSPPLNMGGGTRVIAIYAEYLAKNGHDVLVVSPPRGMKNYGRDGFLRKLKNLFFEVSPDKEKLKSHFDDSTVNQHVINKYRPIIDSDLPDADVVIATWWETAEWVNSLSHSKGVKVYFIQHHEVFDFLPIERCKATYRMPLHKIVIANWLLDLMKNEYADEQVDLVSNSVDKNQFHALLRGKQKIPTVGFLFSNANFKGVDVTLQTIARVKKSIPNLRVISFGSEIPNKVGYWDKSIEFFYSPEQDKIRELYVQCDVWITSSRIEGFNLPVMEAMACRTPIVSTKAGWPEEAIISYVNGVLTEVDDIQALVSAVMWVLNLNNEDWAALSLRAFNTLADSSWDKSGFLFEQALKNALARDDKFNSLTKLS
jgi:glycosyltransferase involved in cell wall biosynthesis